MNSEEILKEISEVEKNDDGYIGRCVRALKLQFPDPIMPQVNLCPNIEIIKAYVAGIKHEALGICPIKELKKIFPDLITLNEKDFFKKPDIHFYNEMKKAYPAMALELKDELERDKKINAY